MADENETDTGHALTQGEIEKLTSGATEAFLSPEAMAQKLAPMNNLARHPGRVFGRIRPVEENPSKRATYATVSDAMAAMIPRLCEVAGKLQALQARLTGVQGAPKERSEKQPPNEDQSIFDHLSYQVLLLARLVAEMDEAVSACQDAVQ